MCTRLFEVEGEHRLTPRYSSLILNLSLSHTHTRARAYNRSVFFLFYSFLL